jgi:hypothetical protein
LIGILRIYRMARILTKEKDLMFMKAGKTGWDALGKLDALLETAFRG